MTLHEASRPPPLCPYVCFERHHVLRIGVCNVGIMTSGSFDFWWLKHKKIREIRQAKKKADGGGTVVARTPERQDAGTPKTRRCTPQH